MGCIHSKNTEHDFRVTPRKSKKSSKRLVTSSRTQETGVEIDGGNNDSTTLLISMDPEEKSAGFTPPSGEERETVAEGFEKPSILQTKTPKKIEAEVCIEQPQMSRVFSVRNGIDGAQVVAGWPPWLTAVAGEAIKGWVPRKADSFEKLDKIGQGTYSSVYRARDLETGKIVALKKVRFVNMDPESVRFMAREILILRRLDHPNVMKLDGLVTSRVSGNLYLVFEYMEHDLAGLAAFPVIKFTESQIKCYMLQLLCGLEHCHSRGILHRDIKGSNLLIDNNGNLKIGDFGLATFFSHNRKQPLTSRVVTLWYRPPELLLGATDYGVAVDLWSAGCILAELFAGRPIMPGRTEVEQLHKIFKLCGSPSDEYWKNSKLPNATIFKPQQPYKCCIEEIFKDFPSSALTLLKSLLAVEPDKRGSTTSAVKSEFFTTMPLPCDPSSLPKYPPSKELDAKHREDVGRQRATGSKGRGVESHRKGSKAVPAPDANAELQTSIKKWLGQANTKSNSEKYNTEEDGATGFPIEPSKGSSQNGLLHGQSMQPAALGGPLSDNVLDSEAMLHSQNANDHSKNGTELKSHRHRPQGAAARLSRFSNSVAGHGGSQFDLSTDSGVSKWPEEQCQLNDAESSHRLLGGPNITYKKDGQFQDYASKKNRIHYSGPLFPPGGNFEEILKEHEKQIQHAVRKARNDRNKTKIKAKSNYSDNAQMEMLLNRDA